MKNTTSSLALAALFTLAGWILHRGGRGGARGGVDEWGRWMSEELGPRLSRPLQLKR